MGRKNSNLAVQATNDETELKINKFILGGLNKVPHSMISIHNLNYLFPSSVLFLDIRIKSTITHEMTLLEMDNCE